MQFTRSASPQVSALALRNLSARRVASGSEERAENSLRAAWISRWIKTLGSLSGWFAERARGWWRDLLQFESCVWPMGSTCNVTVEGWTGFPSMNRSGTGNGLYVSNQSSMRATLLHIGLEDDARALRQRIGNFED